jgi:hypothetical protein
MSDPSDPLEQLAATGPWDGPFYRYRGAEIHCCPGGHVCDLVLQDHPLNGVTFGVVGTITSLVDVSLDERRLPRHLRRKAKLELCHIARPRPPRWSRHMQWSESGSGALPEFCMYADKDNRHEFSRSTLQFGSQRCIRFAPGRRLHRKYSFIPQHGDNSIGKQRWAGSAG